MPETVEDLRLPSGLHVRIPKSQPFFRLWSGEFAGDAYGNKPLLDVDGAPMFPELAILKLFREDGWDGVWVDTFGRKYRTGWGEEGVRRLSGESLRLLNTIHQGAGSASGCFDVYCWKDDLFLFAEVKRRSKDRIRQTQLAWLEAAMRTGLDAGAFLIVEWSPTLSSGGESVPGWADTHQRVESASSSGGGKVSGSGARGAAPPSRADEGYTIFYDAHDADANEKFVKWVERNQRSYVISRRSRSDATIHRAYCGHFKSLDESASLTRTMKVCSRNKGELEAWAREYLTATLRRCRSCM